jgi:hypothetical protein
MCYATGILGMRFGPFFGVSLLRVVRVVLYLWLVELGLVATG